jgi:O-antigen ligase
MFSEVLSKPILGFGFGSKFISGNTILGGWSVGTSQGWVEAHNYFLSFLYRSGFLGLGSFIFIIVNFFRYTFRFLRNCKEQIIKLMIISLMSCIIYILVLGMLEVVLEVPYMGSFLWIIMGIVIVIINYHNKVLNNSGNNRSRT